MRVKIAIIPLNIIIALLLNRWTIEVFSCPAYHIIIVLDIASCLLQSRCLFECHLLWTQVGVILMVLDGGAAIISVDVVICAPIPDLSLLSSTIEGQSLLMGS